MAAKTKAARAGVTAAVTSPYVQRLVQDPAVRNDLRAAYDAGASAYARLSKGKPAAKVVIEDKRFQRDLASASDSLRSVSEALREGPKKRKRRGRGLVRLLLLALVGGGVAVGVNEGLRNKVLDLLFGAEEEFDYTSTTTPSAGTTAPAGTATTTEPITPSAATTVTPESPEAASGTIGT